MTPQNSPAEPVRASSADAPSPVPNEALARLRRIRRQAEARIDALLLFLDSLDGDGDVEDDGTAEPSLGALEVHPVGTIAFRHGPYRDDSGSQTEWSAGLGDDLEASIDDEPHDDDDPAEEDDAREPSLGALEWATRFEQRWSANGRRVLSESRREGSQEQWGSGGTTDLEAEHDGREPDDGECEDEGHDEPSLGARERVADQAVSWAPARDVLDGEVLEASAG